MKRATCPESVLKVEEAGAPVLVLIVVRKVTCLENALRRENLEWDVVEAEATEPASTVGKKVTCPESAHKKENPEWEEVVAVATGHVLTVEKKVICRENAHSLKVRIVVAEAEVAANVTSIMMTLKVTDQILTNNNMMLVLGATTQVIM